MNQDKLIALKDLETGLLYTTYLSPEDARRVKTGNDRLCFCICLNYNKCIMNTILKLSKFTKN